jgi:predicted neutral ceramidase superfamily lipid hydrolase
VIGDIKATTEPILICLAIAFFTGFIYLIVLRVAGGPIVYISLLAMILGTALGGYFLYDIAITETTPTD